MNFLATRCMLAGTACTLLILIAPNSAKCIRRTSDRKRKTAHHGLFRPSADGSGTGCADGRLCSRDGCSSGSGDSILSTGVCGSRSGDDLLCPRGSSGCPWPDEMTVV